MTVAPQSTVASPAYAAEEMTAVGVTPRRTPAVEAFLAEPADHAGTLPWPFPDDLEAFRYTVNVDPARVARQTRAGEWGRHLVDLGGSDYPTIMTEKRLSHDSDPHRVKIRPGMELACWDLLLYYLRDLALAYPALMRLTEEGDAFRWENDLLGTDQRFVLGDWESIPYGPLEFLSREIPDDLLLVTERDGRLYFDAGAVCFAAAWSVSFDVGMDMYEIHGPVPRLHGDGIVARAEQFLMRLPADKVYRRLNWNIAASPSRKFDIALESMPDWGGDMAAHLAAGGIGDVQFRIELEHFIRLPMTGTVTFNIRTFMASLDEVRTVPEWASQLAAVIEELPEDIGGYKGFAAHSDAIVAYLRS
ncbi:heme-dependent oxidative N-demethylase family protein [Streptomyces sp. NPDC050743]|uniref:heme-dependent oxidative N-demethylase family protein n=1 Tax=Streptomyces sp. NPDC050743 TaxID=3365634 RepID=UPI0037928C24